MYTATADGFGISPSYTFADADGDLERTTKIYWYVSDTQDGKYEQIYGGVEGINFEVTEEYLGKYVKYEVIPYDIAVLRGETVWSVPIYLTKADVTVNVGQNGKLMKNETQVTGTENVLASGTYTYKAIPDEGYRVDSVTVTSGGTTVPAIVNAKNEFNVPISSDTSITVTFVEITETELGFLNSDGEKKAGWSNRDEIQADSFYYNNQEKTVNAKIYLGLYQGNMLMALVGSEPMEVKPGKGVHLATDSLVSPKTGDYQVKQFVWDANTCCPLFAPLELKKEMTQNK